MYRTHIGVPGGGGVRGTVQTLAIQRGSGGPDPLTSEWNISCFIQ